MKSLSEIAEQITLASRFGPMFPETRKLVQLLLTTAPTTATSERTFSAMKRLKTCIRNSMSQETLTITSVLHTHKDRLYSLDLNLVDQDFVNKNDKRKNVFGKFWFSVFLSCFSCYFIKFILKWFIKSCVFIIIVPLSLCCIVMFD